MSAYHHNLPHGAGLIIISKAFAEFFIQRHACDEQFIKMARVMGIPHADKPDDFITALVQLQRDCGVADLKMSDYGFSPDAVSYTHLDVYKRQVLPVPKHPCGCSRTVRR